MRDEILVDGHNDLPFAARTQVGHDLSRLDLAAGRQSVRTDIPRLRAGGLGAQFWSAYVPDDLAPGAAVVATLEQIDFIRRLAETYPSTFALARTAADVRRTFAAGRIAGLIGLEGGHSIGNSLAVLRMFAALGARYLTLTHNATTNWADSATDVAVHDGLTSFGLEVVAELNALGMLVDLSHVAATTMHAALDVSVAPVIFSHSCCRAVCDVPRNVPDDVLRRLTGNGGVVMISFVPGFLTADRTAGVADVADHIDHACATAGVDCVGIGSDFDGCSTLPDGLEDVGTYPVLLAELLRRGYEEADVVKIMGGNILRVLEAAERIASSDR